MDQSGGGSGRRRITVSKNGIAESSVETQIRPSPRAPRDSSTPMSSHFRGADNPNWAFTKETEKLINQQEKKMKLTSKETSDFTQNLCSRLKDIDAVADEMVSKVENMKKEMISRKEMDELTDNFSGPNRLRIVTQVKREIRKNKRILLENRELRQCLAEHQTVLEMVMNKFRRVSAHAARLERDYSTMADQNGLNEIKLENQRLTERVGDMLHVMSFAISHDNQKRKKWVDMNNKVYRLQSENANLRQMLHLSKGFGSYQPAEQNEISPSTKKEIILENNTGKFIISITLRFLDLENLMNISYELETDNDVSSSSEDDDEDSFHEGTNQTVINGEIDFITSVIEDQLKMSGAKRSETDFIEDETSEISDVESTTSTIVNDAAISELDSELLTELKPIDIQRARPIENETETTPSPFDDDLGFTTPSTDKDILLATTPSPSEGWQHTTAALETPEMAQHKFIDKYDLPDAVTKPDTVELEEIAPTKSIDEEEAKPIRTTQQSFTIAADDMKNEMTMASTQNQTDTPQEGITESPSVTQQNEEIQEIENNPDADSPEEVGEEVEALPVDENAETEEAEGAETDDVPDEVVSEGNIESDDQVIEEKVEDDQMNPEVQEDKVEIEPIATEEQNNEKVQDEQVDDSPQIEPELKTETDQEEAAVEEVDDTAPEEIIEPADVSEPALETEQVETEEPNREIEQDIEAANKDTDIENVDNQSDIEIKPEDPEEVEIANDLEPVESEPNQSPEVNPEENLDTPTDVAEDVPENVVETISDVNLEVPEINEEPIEGQEDLNEADLIVAETGDTANSPVAKSMMDDFAADLNGRLDEQPSDPAGVVLPDDYEAKSPLSPVIAVDVPELPETQDGAEVNEEPQAVLHEPEKDEEPLKSPEPMAVMIETPNISNEKLDAELDGFDKLNQEQQEAVLEFVKSKLAKEKEVLQEGLADKVAEPVIPDQIPAEPVIEPAHIEENGRMEDDEEDDVIENEIIEPESPVAESDELDKIIDNNAESPAELDKSLYEDDKDVHGVEYHYENNYNQAVGDGKALSWEEHPVEQIKPPSIFDHGEMKEEYYDSYHAQKNPDAYIDNSAYDLEDGSGEVGFENKIIETIVKDAETDHILDNERPKDRKYVVEDLIEQKKAEYHEEKYRELEREEFEESKRSSRGWLLTFGFFGVFFILITRRKVRRLMPSSLGTRGGGGGSSHHGGGRGDKLVTISPERGFGSSNVDPWDWGKSD